MMNPLDELRVLVHEYGRPCTDLCNAVLYDPEFATAPGARSHHHNYRGGLAQHTLEVALHAVAMADTPTLKCQAVVASVFHDLGKIHEYVTQEDGTIVSTSWMARIGHVSWSWHVFVNAAESEGYGPEWIEEVGHALLAHHGRYEWHSPVEPQSRLAYILHTADMLSAKGVTK